MFLVCVSSDHTIACIVCMFSTALRRRATRSSSLDVTGLIGHPSHDMMFSSSLSPSSPTTPINNNRRMAHRHHHHHDHHDRWLMLLFFVIIITMTSQWVSPVSAIAQRCDSSTVCPGVEQCHGGMCECPLYGLNLDGVWSMQSRRGNPVCVINSFRTRVRAIMLLLPVVVWFIILLCCIDES